MVSPPPCAALSPLRCPSLPTAAPPPHSLPKSLALRRPTLALRNPPTHPCPAQRRPPRPPASSPPPGEERR